MARIEYPIRLADRLRFRFLARSLYQLDLGPVSTNLSDLCGRTMRWCKNLDTHTPGRTVSSNRGSAIPGAILDHCVDTVLPQIGQHERRAPVLEASCRIKPLKLEKWPMISPRHLNKRRTTLADRDRPHDLHRKAGSIAPE